MILKSDQELAVESARQFAEMKSNMPLETDRAKIDYIHCVAQAVVLQLEPEYRDLNWEMAIFQSDAVNAFAMPGGKIGVMTGILKAAQNQDQLAAVIGHEIAHVTARGVTRFLLQRRRAGCCRAARRWAPGSNLLGL
jgi:predicted Zn-dependent protease